MEFPGERMAITYSYQGKSSDTGWLVLNLRGLDLEGVNKLYVNLDDLEQLKLRQDRQESQAQFVREFFARKG